MQLKHNYVNLNYGQNKNNILAKSEGKSQHVGRKISMVTVLVLGILKLYFNCTIYEKDIKVQFSNDSWP